MTVTELNQSAKMLLESHFESAEVQGEISRLIKHSSGHWYFTLKDEKSAISCAMFRSANAGVKEPIKDGDKVTIIGKLSIYGPTGGYQLIVSKLLLAGSGALEAAFSELKERLAREGLFSQEHKKPLPSFPERVGIITSASSAAFADMKKVIESRFLLPKFYLFNSLVQGEKAAQNIIKMVKIADSMELDAIVIARGGGSKEDLWCFNDESLARAIFEAKTPIISAVGHEIDYSISDFVADHRSLTPTAAMVDLLPDSAMLYQSLDAAWDRLERFINDKLERSATALALSAHKLKSQGVSQKIAMAKMRLDGLKSNLESLISKILTAKTHKIERLELAISKQGQFYKATKNMIELRKDGKIATLESLKSGDEITLNSQELSKIAVIK